MFTSNADPSRLGMVPWPDDAVARYVAKGYWAGRSLGEHLASADVDPDEICLVDGDVRLSRRDLMSRADGAAVRLRELGLAPDDRVVVQLPNCWELVVLMTACLRLGAIPVMALPAHRRREISTVARHAQATMLAVPDVSRDFDLQAMAHEVAAETPTVRHVLVLGDTRPGGVDLRALCEPAHDPVVAGKELDAIAPDARAIALFFLSGGTTGMPKLIPRTHNDFAYMATQAARICGVGPGSTYLAALPLGHGFPLSGPGVFGTLIAGGRVVIAASPAPERALPLIECERVTITSLVPAAIGRWIEYHETNPGTDLSSLRLLQSGGARLPDQVAVRITPVLRCTLQQVYGMSEGLLCLTRPDDPEEVIRHTQGRPVCPDDELRLVDDQGRPVGPDEPGILLTRGPYTPRGYYRAEELNRRAFVDDGWYRTGDIVCIRRDGNVVIEGRDKDVINRGGEKIPAEEVEHAAYLSGGVRLAAAVAMPDPELGERICLYAVPHAGHTVTLDGVRAAMSAAGVAGFKLPERLVIVEHLPFTNVGKVDKNALRADLQQRLANAVPS
ncbi:AMP-binding protein [Dactylosporangium sp. NPDC000555]|uniref:(2,3-dihydroxybenzoyl)adenylate synthase n=1 Tax=Dactylosporangium sp. NPDC000555 TaxID=3154260 RepID=UPI00332740F2